MVKGIYHSAAGMIARQNQLEVLANNLANADTVGFKEERLSFRNVLDASPRPEFPITRGEQFVTVERGVYGLAQPGALRQTENPLDVAILGEGFFAVETPAGLAYTRDGSFELTEQGELVTLTGYRVVTDGGTAEIPEGALRISSEGELILEGQEPGMERALDRLTIVTFDNPFDLRPLQDGLLTTNQPPRELDLVRVEPGYLEESNVNPVTAMVEMIELNQIYDALSNAIKTQDTSVGKVINDVGKTR